MEPWTVSEFRKSRARTWRAVRLWLLLDVASLAGFMIPFWVNPATRHIENGSRSRVMLSTSDMTLWQLNLSFGSFIGLGVSVFAITAAVQRYYRCPKCESVLRVHWRVTLYPSACPNCGAKLS